MTPSSPEYRTISLTQNQQTVVTQADYERFGGNAWYAKLAKHTGKFYAYRNAPRVDGKRMSLLLHREILGLKRGDRRQGDHINRDTLNNIHTDDPETNNLRIATHEQNVRNSKRPRTNTSGYKGVYWGKKEGKWKAQVGRKVIGYFDTPEEGYAAYCKAVIELYGEFARLT